MAVTKDGTDLSFSYDKETIFNNGETSVEYYKRPNSETLFITFDSVNIRDIHEPFGLKFLKTLDVDVLAFRKKRKHGYTPDFSIQDFIEVTKAITPNYKRKIAYGFSLGAYAALYYATRIDCEVFAIAPRVPAHPIYGTKIKDQLVFNHELHLKANNKIQPIIAYDPKNKIDHKYFNHEILPNFPKLKVIKSSYAGHKVAQHYVQMGVLKQMVLSIYEGQDVKYDRKLRYNSTQYLGILSETCLKKKKYNWAYAIAEKSLTIDPMDKRANLIKAKVIIEGCKDYLQVAIKSIENVEGVEPKSLCSKLQDINEQLSQI